MTFVSTKDLKDSYSRSYLKDVEAYTKLVTGYLSDAVKRHNTSVDNTITVGLATDYRIANARLYSAEDTTSPEVELGYGLLKNNKYSVPPNLIPKVSEELDKSILALVNLGYTVQPFWAYARGFDIIQDGVFSEYFVPVKCYKIRWSNL